MLSERISDLRKEYGLTQAEVAKKLGVSPSAVGMYEQGRREPSLELVVAYAELFSVTTDYLLTGYRTNRFPLSTPEGETLSPALSTL